jgi:hypothetical protein
MALSDWLNPTPAAPTYLTSRAQGVVVPQYYQAASAVRKNALDLAGQEQTLYSREEDLQKNREQEAAAAAILPGITSLDPNSPSYYDDLSKMLQQPGAANALANKSVGAFLGIQGSGRAETINEARYRESAARDEARTKRDEEKYQQETVRRDQERALQTGMSLADRTKEWDPTFYQKYEPRIKAAKTSQERDSIIQGMHFDAAQGGVEYDLASVGLPEDQRIKLKENLDGKQVYGVKARNYLAELKARELLRRDRTDKRSALVQILRAANDAGDIDTANDTREKLQAMDDATGSPVGGASGGVAQFGPKSKPAASPR